jgi:hypothetical protein
MPADARPSANVNKKVLSREYFMPKKMQREKGKDAFYSKSALHADPLLKMILTQRTQTEERRGREGESGKVLT